MRLFRNFLKGASLTTALFIFQACYGTPQGMEDYPETVACFQVVSSEDGLPLDGICVKRKVSNSGDYGWILSGYTDNNGWYNMAFNINAPAPEQVPFRFESEDGEYAAKDTVISDFSHTIKIVLDKVVKAE